MYQLYVGGYSTVQATYIQISLIFVYKKKIVNLSTGNIGYDQIIVIWRCNVKKTCFLKPYSWKTDRVEPIGEGRFVVEVISRPVKRIRVAMKH